MGSLQRLAMASTKLTDDGITVAMVEDQAETRLRLAQALEQADGLNLIASFEDARSTLAWLQNNLVDVLLVDLGLPDLPGLAVIAGCRQLQPKTEIMVITMFGDEANMMQAFEAGARGYLLKDGTEEDLAQHVLNLHAGGSPVSPIIARQLLGRLSPTAKTPGSAMLTQREHEILTKLARGYTYAEVGELMGVAASTVQSHVKNIYSKLAVHSKTEAIFEAKQMGLI
jgi:DNA-binding NarL/FixJ family response regulator